MFSSSRLCPALISSASPASDVGHFAARGSVSLKRARCSSPARRYFRNRIGRKMKGADDFAENFPSERRTARWGAVVRRWGREARDVAGAPLEPRAAGARLKPRPTAGATTCCHGDCIRFRRPPWTPYLRALPGHGRRRPPRKQRRRRRKSVAHIRHVATTRRADVCTARPPRYIVIISPFIISPHSEFIQVKTRRRRRRRVLE